MRLLAQTTDAAHLARLHAQCFADPWSADSFAVLLESPATIALSANEGFVVIRIAGGESEILSLGVLPAARRRGIASALLKGALDHAQGRGATAMFLEVGESNSPAIALYKQNGFHLVGCRKGYYGQPNGPRENALVFRVDIPPAKVGNGVQLG